MELYDASEQEGGVGAEEAGNASLLLEKLCVTALLVHHLSLWSNYSQFHLVKLLCPPRCTIMVMCKCTEIQKLGVKAEEGILFTSQSYTQLYCI